MYKIKRFSLNTKQKVSLGLVGLGTAAGAALGARKALIDACETVYCPCMEFGVCNSYNQELYFYAKKQNKLKNLSE